MTHTMNDPLGLSLSGRTALVCGASAGIGRACALSLAQLGARVIALARSEDKLRETVAALPGAGHDILALDLNDHAALVSALKNRGPIEILVNNSAGPKGGPIVEAAPDEFVRAFSQHVLTSQILVQTLLPGMREKNYGRVVNIVSTSVRAPIPGLGVSNTIRGATASWAKTLAGEVGRYGVTVNCVLPGLTMTDRLDSLLKSGAEKAGRPVADLEREWKALVPVQRFAEAREIAAAVAFLSSPAAGYISGVALAVDGGRLPVM